VREEFKLIKNDNGEPIDLEQYADGSLFIN